MTVTQTDSALAAAARQGERPFGIRFVLPLALGNTLNPINSTMIATALVPIARDLGVTAAQVGWLIAGLYLSSAVAQPAMGRFADRFGARRTFLWSLALVIASGVIGALAPTLSWLVVARVVMGIGSSGAYPAAMRLFRHRAEQFGTSPPRVAMGVLSLAALSTAAVGPLLGGVLTQHFGWHAIFTANIPLAVLSLALVALWVPRDPPRDPQAPRARLADELDPVGMALFALALILVMLFLLDIAAPKWWALVLGLVFGAGLVRHSLRVEQPFIDLRMLGRNLPLSVTYLRISLAFMVIYCNLFGFSQWLEAGAGFSESTAGLLMLPMSALAAVSSLVAARTKGLRVPFIVCTGSAFLGCIGLLTFDSGTPAWVLAAVMTLFSLPQGMFSTATQAAIYMQAPAEQIGTAAGLQRTAIYIGAILSTGLLGIIFGDHATDAGLHAMATVVTCLSGGLFLFTLIDPTVPRGRI